MNPLRSVGARLALALVLAVAGALSIAYLVVVPSLRQSLVDSKVRQLEGSAPALARRVPTFFPQGFVENASATANARVVLLSVLAEAPLTLTPIADSRQGQPSDDVLEDPIALRAARTFEPSHGTVTDRGERFAEAAVPTRYGSVLLLQSSLSDADRTVALVSRRVLIAGLLALVFAIVAGYLGATLFARRVRRLEAAAERIADGDFDEPFEDRRRDELGDLARTFERMRARLAQLDHARREFIANASHELRTPLFSLGGFIELLQDEDLDDATQREFLETMREQVERLTRLATDLLDLSRLDAGRLHVEAVPLELGPLARDLVDEFRGLALAGGHELEAVAHGDTVALADEQRTQQIARALVGNALRHTPSGSSVRVEVRAAGEEARLTVEDDGPGIPAEHTQHVFERFYRIDGAHASGSGLGLAIARELAELMGGRIELESRPGLTRLTLVLPRGTDAPAFSRENAPAAVR
ncbi:MAG: hypothetical protein QOE36_3312 [Gaiellaceae bacterium]|nr:hypothetical protein [Gaiellaceae bacterium]